MSIVQHEVEHSKIGLSKKIQKKIDEAIAKIPKQGGAGGGGVEDVNVDGKIYGRRNGKWVEVESGGVATETDPIFSASEAANFVAGDKANLDNQSGVNTGDQDLSGYLTHDQTTPQTVTEGIPIFKDGCPAAITRNADGFITKKEYKNGYYIEYTRNASNIITSCTDGTNTWTPTYSSGFITSVAVT
jgi:hypothetical protein